jgi:hypothetical protein
MPAPAQLNPEPSPWNSVRITLPVSVAYDLEKFQAALGNIARRTGHLNCASGVDCTFLSSREWIVDPETLEVGDAVAGR